VWSDELLKDSRLRLHATYSEVDCIGLDRNDERGELSMLQDNQAMLDKTQALTRVGENRGIHSVSTEALC
jgi:hypothetical protein